MSVENKPISGEDRTAYINALFENDGLSYDQFLEQRVAEKEEARITIAGIRRSVKRERYYQRKQRLRKLIKWR